MGSHKATLSVVGYGEPCIHMNMKTHTHTHICREKKTDTKRDRGRDEQGMEGRTEEGRASSRERNNTLSHGSAVCLNFTMGIPTQYIPVLA